MNSRYYPSHLGLNSPTPGSLLLEEALPGPNSPERPAMHPSFHASAATADTLRQCLDDGHELTPYNAWSPCGDCPICGAHWHRGPQRGEWLAVYFPDDYPSHRPEEQSGQQHMVPADQGIPRQLDVLDAQAGRRV